MCRVCAGVPDASGARLTKKPAVTSEPFRERVQGSERKRIPMTQPAQATEPILLAVSSVMRGEDASDLRWYFRSGGISMLTSSNWGAALERLSKFAYGCAECEDCGGNREKKIPGDGLERKAQTKKQSELLALIDLHVPELTGEWCPKCDGRGMIARSGRAHSRAPLTARPTGSSKHGRAAIDVDHGDLARLGSVSRRVAKLAETDSAAAMVLELYYGPDHDSTTLPLYQLTPAGKTLLRRNGQRLHWRQFFENESSDARAKKDKRRLALLDEAKEQAQEYYRAACQAWNTVHRKGKR